MKLISWNVNSVRVRLEQIKELLKETDCDVLALQETKATNEFFPIAEFEQLGYKCLINGQKSYNGVALIAKAEFMNIKYDFLNQPSDDKRVVSASIGKYHIINIYIVNGSEVKSPKFTYKLEWLERLLESIENSLKKYKDIIICGDFNIAPEEIDTYDPKKWNGKVSCTEVERNWFKRLLKLGFTDSVRFLHTDETIYSWWDYRTYGFKTNSGLRIDHILVNEHNTDKLLKAEVISKMRGLTQPSDHAPVFLELEN